MDDIRNLKELQLDALREVANIGAGHGATALSQLTDRRIMISVPEILTTKLEDVPGMLKGPQEIVAAVMMHMLGDLTGRTLLLLPQEDAMLLCDLLLKREPGTTKTFDEIEQSSLKEAGNILGGAYLNALSDFMGMMLLPSVPSLLIDVSTNVLTTTYTNFGQDGEEDYALCVETDFYFQEVDRRLIGHFLLLPNVASLRAIFEAIQVH